MKQVLVFAAVLVLMSACSSGTTPATSARDGVFVHITHGTDDAHRVAMALTMAAIMSEDHDVLVYFDIHGIDVVLKDAPDISYSHFASSKTQLSVLAGRGITLAACPGCLKAAGKTENDLAPGVTVAEKAKFFNFTRGRIVTLDY